MSNTLSSGLLLVSLVSGGAVVQPTSTALSAATFADNSFATDAGLGGDVANTASSFATNNLLPSVPAAVAPVSDDLASASSFTNAFAAPLSTGLSGDALSSNDLPPFPTSSVSTNNFLGGVAPSGFLTSFTSGVGALGTGSIGGVGSTTINSEPALFATGTDDTPSVPTDFGSFSTDSFVGFGATTTNGGPGSFATGTADVPSLPTADASGSVITGNTININIGGINEDVSSTSSFRLAFADTDLQQGAASSVDDQQIAQAIEQLVQIGEQLVAASGDISSNSADQGSSDPSAQDLSASSALGASDLSTQSSSDSSAPSSTSASLPEKRYTSPHNRAAM